MLKPSASSSLTAMLIISRYFHVLVTTNLSGSNVAKPDKAHRSAEMGGYHLKANKTAMKMKRGREEREGGGGRGKV